MVMWLNVSHLFSTRVVVAAVKMSVVEELKSILKYDIACFITSKSWTTGS
jgi:hypothetical protein